MKHTRLKPISEKQKERLKLWEQIRLERIKELVAERGYAYCEECNLWGFAEGFPEHFKYLVAHHRDGNRRNNTKENCQIIHRVCHSLGHHNKGRRFSEEE
jgi:hypothetical protein